MKKRISELVEDFAKEQTEKILGDLVDRKVFVEVNQGQDEVKEEWDRAKEDV